MRVFLIFFLILMLLISSACSRQARVKRNYSNNITCKSRLLKDNRVEIKYAISSMTPETVKEISLYRSTANLDTTVFDRIMHPVSKFSLDPEILQGTFTDTCAADNVKYFYILEVTDTSNVTTYSRVSSLVTHNKPIDNLKSPSILIDKKHYFLEVRDSEQIIKRYPVVFGKDPSKQKLNQDNKSTPEGIYAIYNVQTEATYRKAYDINYPTQVDKVRYELGCRAGLVPKDRGIGGEIQVHAGNTIEGNWTAGCIALRNDDIDELFAHSRLGVDSEVIIVGNTVTREDVESIKKYSSPEYIKKFQVLLRDRGYDPGNYDGVMGENTLEALGRFQLAQDLPLTCQLDTRTVKALEQKIHKNGE